MASVYAFELGYDKDEADLQFGLPLWNSDVTEFRGFGDLLRIQNGDYGYFRVFDLGNSGSSPTSIDLSFNPRTNDPSSLVYKGATPVDWEKFPENLIPAVSKKVESKSFGGTYPCWVVPGGPDGWQHGDIGWYFQFLNTVYQSTAEWQLKITVAVGANSYHLRRDVIIHN